MKSKFLTASLVASALWAGLGTVPAIAQGTYTPAIDRAQQAITSRIQQGLATGQITPSEARELYRRDREIDLRESRFKANGSATPQERQQLRVDLDNLGVEVERMIGNQDRVVQSTNTNGIDNRQFNIGERIDEGARLGRISQSQARRLHNREREIARREVSFKRDGVVTPQERRQLQNELTRLSEEVNRMARNNR
jgi:hypothetical protein